MGALVTLLARLIVGSFSRGAIGYVRVVPASALSVIAAKSRRAGRESPGHNKTRKAPSPPEAFLASKPHFTL